jgi:hypothetical protein
MNGSKDLSSIDFSGLSIVEIEVIISSLTVRHSPQLISVVDMLATVTIIFYFFFTGCERLASLVLSGFTGGGITDIVDF